MEMKIGKVIEERLKAQNVNVTKFAEALHTSRNNVYDIFERDSIDTDLLKKIGHLLNYDFFQDLLEPKTIREIVIKHSMTNKIYVELTVEKLGIKDKVLKKIT